MTQSLRCALVLTLLLRAAPGSPDLSELLERYDRESNGPAKNALAARIDAAAHQKYATVSRLYWHTDLASAKAAAHASRRPILHLRMLGNLDEDLSCANSRLFRATLYANHDVSGLLRERFILYWSSERPVPRVTIDYGDGRTLVRTTAGNSAHYVLDEDGNVLDVLPGLYAPAAFRRELEGSLALAARVRGKSEDERAALIVDYHSQQLIATQRVSAQLTAMPSMRRLLTEARVQSPIAAAQRGTITKSGIEVRDLRAIARELPLEDLSENQVEMWYTAGRMLYGTGDRKVTAPIPILDEDSRALVLRLHNDVPLELRATGWPVDAMIARLERTLVADSALNQLRLRPQIAREFVRRNGRTDFETLNTWIYAEVFRSPKQDAWLGLLPRNVFTGLVGDGVVSR